MGLPSLSARLPVVPASSPVARKAKGKIERFQVPGWPDRPYDLYVPRNADRQGPIPVVLVFHGWRMESERQRLLMCPEGDLTSEGSMEALADRDGFAIAYLNGTLIEDDNPKRGRCWNAGGGKYGYCGLSPPAFERNVDDVGYVKSALKDIEQRVRVDQKRIYAAGISNGGAMVQRLGMEMSERFAAIAAVSGGNQFETSSDVRPSRPIPLIQFHGTTDPVWPYLGGPCVIKQGILRPIPDSVDAWVDLNHAQHFPELSWEPNITADGTVVQKETHPPKEGGAEVTLYNVYGGGHSWPGGQQFSPLEKIGRVSQDINANALIWAFFKKHPLTS